MEVDSLPVTSDLVFDESRFNRYSLGTDGKRSKDTVHVWEDGCLHSLGCSGLG